MINEVCNNNVVVQTSLMKRPSMGDLITAVVIYFMLGLQIRHFSILLSSVTTNFGHFSILLSSVTTNFGHFSILLSSMTTNFEVLVVTFIVAMFLGWEVNWGKKLHAVSV